MARSKVDAKLLGTANVTAELGSLTPQVREAAGDSLEWWGEQVQTDAQRDVPVDTGRLRDSIEADTDRAELETTVGTGVFYAEWTEQGNSRQKAQPFLRPAFELNRGRFRRDLRDRVRRELS